MTIKAAQELFIVTNPSLPALTDALKTIELARSIGTTPKGVIINMHTGKDYELSVKNVEEFLGLPVISVIPDDDKVRKSLTKKKSVIEAFPDSKASISFMQAAARLVGQEYKDLVKQGFFSRIKNFLK
jgi:septum site-determining protein MinD